MNGRWKQLKTSRVTGFGSFLKEGRMLPNQTSEGQTRAVREGECQAGELLPSQERRPTRAPFDKAAFSLIELMVVLGIIGLLTTLGLPMIKALNQNSALSAASRQLVDDISLARMKAINNRTTVYMVFSPTNLPVAYATLQSKGKFGTDPRPYKILTNLVGGQFGAYALVAARTVGDQPGSPHPRYLTEWRTLPEGIFIAPSKFAYMTLDVWSKVPATNRPFAFSDDKFLRLPFPTAESPPFPLPYIAFSPLGQLVYPVQPQYGQDEIIPLTRGSMMVEKDLNGQNIMGKADFREIPPGNATNLYNRVHIFWQTGRAKVEKLEVK